MSATKETFDPNLEKFTIVLLGGPSVGKSALTLRMVTENFVKDYDPTIEDIYLKKIVVDGMECGLSNSLSIIGIVDTAGNDDFAVLVDSWINEGDGFLLVFSIIDRKSFGILETKKGRILKMKEHGTPPMLLLGNKCDLEHQRAVNKEEAEGIANSWKMEYLEVSAKVISPQPNRIELMMKKPSLR